jgi:hypothetical protein
MGGEMNRNYSRNLPQIVFIRRSIHYIKLQSSFLPVEVQSKQTLYLPNRPAFHAFVPLKMISRARDRAHFAASKSSFLDPPSYSSSTSLSDQSDDRSDDEESKSKEESSSALDSSSSSSSASLSDQSDDGSDDEESKSKEESSSALDSSSSVSLSDRSDEESDDKKECILEYSRSSASDWGQRVEQSPRWNRYIPTEIIDLILRNFVDEMDWDSWQKCAKGSDRIAKIAHSAFDIKDFSFLIEDKNLDEDIAVQQLKVFDKRYTGRRREILCNYAIEWLHLAIFHNARSIVFYILYMDELKQKSLQTCMKTAAYKFEFTVLETLILREKLLYESRWGLSLENLAFVSSLGTCFVFVCRSETQNIALADMILSTIEQLIRQSGDNDDICEEAARRISCGIPCARKLGHTLILMRILSYPFGLNIAAGDYHLPPEIRAEINKFALPREARRRLHIMRKWRSTTFRKYDSDSYHSSS